MKALVRLYISKEISDSIGTKWNYQEIYDKFLEAARSSGYENAVIMVEEYGSCNRTAIIEIAGPVYPTYTDITKENFLWAWNEMKKILNIGEIADPAFFFSTGNFA